MSMDWVFCNKCTQKYQSNIKFYLLDCGHIVCARCNQKYSNNQCQLCKKTTSFIELNKNMDPSIQQFFWPLEKTMDQSLRVFNFQTMHKKLYLQGLNNKYTFAKKECIKVYSTNRKLLKENQMMRDMLKSMGCNVPASFITSTPCKSLEGDPNFSMISSIRNTPAPGMARRVQNFVGQHGPSMKDISINRSMQSPAQTVPRLLAPVHYRRPQPLMPNQPPSMNPYMDQMRGKVPTMGCPRNENY